MEAALVDAPGIGHGTLVGLNIANTLLVLGVSAMLYPSPILHCFTPGAAVMVAVRVLFAAVAATMPLARSCS